jgi:biotin carboxyl carrier protein
MNKIIAKMSDKEIVQSVLAEVSEETDNHFIVISKDQPQEIFVTSMGQLSDGNSIDGIDIETEPERERIVRKRFAKYQVIGNSNGSTKGMILKASMPGMVRVISVSIGDIVQKNTQVLVLEAMKMENSITAGFAGIITKIHVEPGMSVEKSMPLMEFKAREDDT